MDTQLAGFLHDVARVHCRRLQRHHPGCMRGVPTSACALPSPPQLSVHGFATLADVHQFYPLGPPKCTSGGPSLRWVRWLMRLDAACSAGTPALDRLALLPFTPRSRCCRLRLGARARGADTRALVRWAAGPCWQCRLLVLVDSAHVSAAAGVDCSFASAALRQLALSIT